MASPRSAVGDIKILEVNQDGKFIRLFNDGAQVCVRNLYLLISLQAFITTKIKNIYVVLEIKK